MDDDNFLELLARENNYLKAMVLQPMTAVDDPKIQRVNEGKV